MEPIGPYCHIARAGNLICISATAGVDPATGLLVGPTVYAQAHQILASMRSMLVSAGSSFGNVLHIRIYLKDMSSFAELNRAYAEALGDFRPARTVVEVSDLPKAGALLTMDAMAVVC